MTDEQLLAGVARLNQVVPELLTRYRRLKTATIALAVTAVAAVILTSMALVGWVRDSDRAACQSGNQVRSALSAFVDFIDMPPAVVPPDATAEQRAAADRHAAEQAAVIAEARRALVLRDCP
jgi:hypothetical protein